MAKLGILFAGQGGQYSGLGTDWLKQDPDLSEYRDLASKAFGFDLQAVLEAEDGRIHETLHAQPAIVLSSFLAYQVLVKETHLVPSAMAGFSLGEYTALMASQVFSFEEGMNLLHIRATAMQECAKRHPGSMAAILGMDPSSLEHLCEEVSSDVGVVRPANYNCPGQLVISGEKAAVEVACARAKASGAKRCIPLQVSGGFHSPLMEEASPLLRNALAPLHPGIMEFPLYANVTGKPYDPVELKDNLVKQITSPVRFEETLRHMSKSGITHYLEIGPGTALSGFVRKTNPEAFVTNLDTVSQWNQVKGWLMEHGFAK